MLVSVCMPTYNQESYIEMAIKGVIMQQNCSYELIIANDCSTDKTLDICEKYQKMYPDIIQIIKQPYNKGIIENTKECLLTSKGEYVAICEGDDYWVDINKLQKQVSILSNDKNISMVHTNWIDYYENYARFQSRYNEIKNDYICESERGKRSVEEIMMDDYRGIRFSSICFRKDMFLQAYKEDSSLFSSLYSTCDIVLFYELAYRGKIYYLPEETTVYRIQNESVSITSNRDKSAKFTKGVLCIQAHYLDKFQLPNSVRDKIFRSNFQVLFPWVLHKSEKKIAYELKNMASNAGYSLRFGQLLCYIGSFNKILKKVVEIIIMFNRLRQ